MPRRRAAEQLVKHFWRLGVDMGLHDRTILLPRLPKEQPDLNWRNPDVRAAIYAVMGFWLDLGVDGFRIDVLWHLMKDVAFRDNPINPAYTPGQPEISRFLQIYSADRPEIVD